ncbi:MAG TPA: Do family serine endopeptidase [Chthoniobacteraceae bacterium]
MKLLSHLLPTRWVLVGQIAATAAFAPLALAQTAAPPSALPPSAPPENSVQVPAMKIDPSPLRQVPGTLSTFAPVVEKVAPAVVTISTTKAVRRGAAGVNPGNPYLNDPTLRRFFGLPDPEDEAGPGVPPGPQGPRGGGRRGGQQALGLGSGVIVSPDGHILTNNHVIEGADEILVTLANSKQQHTAKKIGTDPGTDLAILKIEAKDLHPVTFADSDKLRVGDLAIAVGNPFGLSQSVTMGIVSALGRGGMNGARITEFEDFIQTDASINPGNSGGALVDTEGRLIGINTAIFSRSGGNMGIGFAVPANLARSVLDSILKTGRVTRGFLGIELQPLDESLAAQFKLSSTSGALVTEVTAKSPAEKAGIETGDVVVEVNNKKVEGPRELQLMVAAIAPGTKVNVKVLRDTKERVLSVELAERPGAKLASANPGEPKSTEPDVLDGVTVGDLDPQLRKEFEIAESVRSGVVVTKVDPESPSADAGIKAGDVILEVNRQPVNSAKDAVDLSEKLKAEKKVMLRVASKGTSRYVVVERKE